MMAIKVFKQREFLFNYDIIKLVYIGDLIVE